MKYKNHQSSPILPIQTKKPMPREETGLTQGHTSKLGEMEKWLLFHFQKLHSLGFASSTVSLWTRATAQAFRLLTLTHTHNTHTLLDF